VYFFARRNCSFAEVQGPDFQNFLRRSWENDRTYEDLGKIYDRLKKNLQQNYQKVMKNL